MESNDPGDGTDSSGSLTPTERAIFGPMSALELRGFLDRWTRRRLGSSLRTVRFRAGRIDAVWGVELQDSSAVVLKAHRPPTDLATTWAAIDAQGLLASVGFPCATPLAGPEQVEGHTLTAETFIVGNTPDGTDPGMQLLLADGLARHIHLLQDRPDLVSRAGLGPSWCRYQSGPWPVPHDPIVDFSSTPAGFEWLDAFGQRAAEQVLRYRDADSVVVGHADWYAGNTVVKNNELVGTFDWELVADAEAVIAGFAAACFAASSTSGGGLSGPREVAGFCLDYEQVRGRPFSPQERLTATGAAAWILAFNARWLVGLIQHGLCGESTLSMVRDHGDQYLTPTW